MLTHLKTRINKYSYNTYSIPYTLNFLNFTTLLSNYRTKFVDFYKIFFFFRFHPHFKNVMQSRISQMMGVNYKFDLLLSEDGSGRGAALVAAVLKRGKNGSTQ